MEAIKNQLTAIAERHSPKQADTETDNLIPLTLKQPNERPTCGKCGYLIWESSEEEGLCRHCFETKKEIERLLQDQRDRPERVLYSWGVPKKHLNSSFTNYHGGEEVKKFIIESGKTNKDILLCGKTGCGKTHLAVSLMRRKVEVAPKPFDDYRRLSAIFVTVPELLFEIRQTFGKDGVVDSERNIVDKYSEVPLLVLDDLGAEKTTEWAESTLYLIIDRRNRDEKWTIVTSNLTLPEIEQSLGARIASRLSDMKVINIKLPDYRKKR